ncbi:MAG: ribosome silencing factor [Chloroflexi bacterium]|nr:ribosome silencing factor [Chloroflexota bacterium]
METSLVSSLDVAHSVVNAVESKKGSDILVLDLRSVSVIADFFVIVTGDNERQIKAIADHIFEDLKEQGKSPYRKEGSAASGWVIVDYSDVVVHIFAPQERTYYQLERLWSEANVVMRMA